MFMATRVAMEPTYLPITAADECVVLKENWIKSKNAVLCASQFSSWDRVSPRMRRRTEWIKARRRISVQ